MNLPTSIPSRPTEDEIARRARQLWDERGRPANADVAIWLEAERQLISERTPVAAAPVRKTPRTRRGTASKDIDQAEVAERLDDYGEPPRRSATSLDLT